MKLKMTCKNKQLTHRSNRWGGIGTDNAGRHFPHIPETVWQAAVEIV